MRLTFLILFAFIASFTHAQSWSLIGPEGGFFKDFVIHPTNTDIVYAGSDDGGGVWKTTDGGESWTLLTGEYPNFTGWHITMDEAHPDTLYFCEMYGRYGILKTTDGGATFTHQTDGFVFDRDLQTTSLAIYPGAGDTLFAATGEAEDEYGRVGNGVFKSINGGENWSYSGLQGTAIPCIASTPTGRILAGTADEGLHFSDDLGETWELHPDIPDTAAIMQIDHMDDVWIVAAGANGVFQSLDNGSTFELIGAFGQLNFDIAILRTSPEIEIISSGFFGPLRYAEGTGLWEPIDDPLFEGHLLIGIEARDGIIYNGIFSSTQIIRSTDNGENYSKMDNNPIASEIRAMVVDSETNTLYASVQNSYNFSGDAYNKESMAIRDEFGDWVYTGPIAHGLDLAMNPEDENTIYLGTFAQGLFKTTDGFETWENIRTGNVLVMGLAINPESTNEVLISEYNIAEGSFGIYKSEDAGDSWYKTGEFVANDIAYTDNDTVYFSHETGIYMSEDNGESVPVVPAYLGGDVVLSLAYSAPYLYAGTEEGELYMIDQSGTVAEITGPWNSGSPTPVHNLIYAGNSIIVGLSGAEQDTLHSLNGGVWQSIDNGETWVDLTDGLTNNNIFGNTGLAIDAAGNVLAATYGQGIFQSNDIILGLEDETELSINVELYPNPFVEDLTISVGNENLIIGLEIYTVDGKMAYRDSAINSNSIEIKHSHLETGVYLITIETIKGVVIKKIVVE